MKEAERKKTVRSIVLFSLLVTVVAWLSPLLGGSPSSPGLGFILWGTAPMLIALLLRAITRDWSAAGLQPVIRRNARWYLISIVAFPIMTVFTIMIGEVTGVSTFTGFALGPYLKTFLVALPIFLSFAVFEEFGWRGYLAPKLASIGINTYLASAIVALVWATWHMPYIRELTWAYSTEALSIFIPRYYLALFAFAILYHEIRLMTGTIWPAVLMHGITNAFGHPLTADFLTIAPGKDYLVSASGLLMIAFTGLLGIALNRWRKKQA